MKKNMHLIFTVFPVVCLGILTLYLAILRTCLPEVTVKIEGYDPRDLLSGHYIAYTIDWDKTDCKQFPQQICPKEDFFNIAKQTFWRNSFRFYIPEQYAQELDDTLRNNSEKNNVFEIVYSYAPGLLPLAKRLLINGKDWREYLR